MPGSLIDAEEALNNFVNTYEDHELFLEYLEEENEDD